MWWLLWFLVMVAVVVMAGCDVGSCDSGVVVLSVILVVL